MNLFEYKNWKLELKPEAFTVKAFKALMDRDKSKDKRIGIQELEYVFHMADNVSPFASYLDDARRSEDVIKKVIKEPNWKPDALVLEAVEVYKELDETITSRYLESVKIALSKIDAYFRRFTIDDDTEAADIKRVDDMIGTSIDRVKSIRELEKLVMQDRETGDVLKGGRKKPLFTDDE